MLYSVRPVLRNPGGAGDRGGCFRKEEAAGTAAKPGPAKITTLSPGSSHPYHLIHTDSTSNVYGWVDAGDVSGQTSGEECRTYTVQAGDSLWAIAQKLLGNGNRWQEISTLNGLTSTTIQVGQQLKLPQ